MYRWRWMRAGYLVALAGLVSAHVMAAPPSELMDKIGRSDMTVGELRIRVRSLANRFSGEIEELADTISARAGEPETRLQMTRLKINAIPAMQAALFQPDPVAALLDTWALLAQLQQSLGKLASTQLKEQEDFARKRFRRMEEELEQLWRALTKQADISATQSEIHQWAKEHPLTETVASRESTASLLANVTTRSGIGPLRSVSVLVEDMQDLAARIDVLSAYLPKQARWQAEHMALQTLTAPSVRAAGAEVPKLAASTERMMRAAGSYPSVIARERTALLSAIEQERLAMQEFFSAERRAVLAETDRLGTAWVDRAFDRAAALADRAFRWLLLLVALLLVGGLGALLIVLSAWKRRDLARGQLRERTA